MLGNLQYIIGALALLSGVIASSEEVGEDSACITKPPKNCTGGPYDVLKSCGTVCPLTCDNPKPGPCTKQCAVNVCECKAGYVRNGENGQCIKPEECPPKCTKKCIGGPHDKCSLCASACPRTCEKPNPEVCILVCRVNVCECEKGYVRHPNGQCVLEKDCPCKRS